MAKRKAGVKDIIYELDDDIVLSSDDGEEAPMGGFEEDIRKKQRRNAPITPDIVTKRYNEVINLDCSSVGPCDSISPNSNQNGGKTTQTDDIQKTNCNNQNNVEDSKINDEDLLHNTLVFHDHNFTVDSPSNSDLGVVGCENRIPLVTVRFKDSKLAHTYRKRVKELLINLFKSQSNDNVDLSEDSDVEIDIWPEELTDEVFDNIDKVSNGYSKDVAIEELDNVSDVDDSLFFVDTAPCDDAQTDIPKYSQNSSIITNIVEEEASSPTKRRRGPTCFNCDGAHVLKDCQLPRNHTRIAANRKNMIPRVGRYHVEDEQKYGHLVPGRISGKLRHALGLKRYQLPLHIYRMRVLGYPPGWLEEARISHSGITLFDSTGNATQDPEEEDGELCEPGSKDKFDIKKILDFPGYNVCASSQYIEESHMFGLPPMSEQDSKMEMLQALAPNATKAYKRKKLTFFPSANHNFPLEGQAEMEIDSGDEIPEFPSIPPLPDEAPPPPLPPPPPPPPPPPLEELPSPENHDKSDIISNLPDKSKNTKQNDSNKKELLNDDDKNFAHKEKENVTNEKTELTTEIDLASLSEDELQVIEVVHVTDIPVPEDDLISIDDDDDDKSQISCGLASPSLAALEEKKRRLLNALTGDSDVSMEFIVFDETMSDNSDDADEEKPGTIDQTETEEGTTETDGGENSTTNIEPDNLLTVEVNVDRLPDEDLKIPEANTCEVEKTCNVNEESKITELEKSTIETKDKSISAEKSSTVNEEKDPRGDRTSISNKEVKSAIVVTPIDVNELEKPDTQMVDDQVEKESSRTKDVNTPDSKTGQVKNTAYGTPVMNVLSPFVKLPSDDKFAKNICDVINFENLPNSTGKFKQIRSLLKKVKSAVDSIQDS